SKAEIKKEMLKSFRKGGMKLPSLDKIKDVKQSLPNGIHLQHIRFIQEENRLIMSIGLRFRHVKDLKNCDFGSILSMPKPQQKGGMSMNMKQDTPGEKPLPFEVQRKNGEILLLTPLKESQTKSANQLKMMPPQMKSLFQSMVFRFQIKAPFPVLEHNGHKKEGNTIIWNYTLDKLEKLEKNKKPLIFIRMKSN
ncbi:MAG: hypothetical protein D6785_06445, partial [Planctomycetota bacterium]